MRKKALLPLRRARVRPTGPASSFPTAWTSHPTGLPFEARSTRTASRPHGRPSPSSSGLGS
eukprot:8209890-Pyramimonas_sp.AAC.1